MGDSSFGTNGSNDHFDITYSLYDIDEMFVPFRIPFNGTVLGQEQYNL